MAPPPPARGYLLGTLSKTSEGTQWTFEDGGLAGDEDRVNNNDKNENPLSNNRDSDWEIVTTGARSDATTPEPSDFDSLGFTSGSEFDMDKRFNLPLRRRLSEADFYSERDSDTDSGPQSDSNEFQVHSERRRRLKRRHEALAHGPKEGSSWAKQKSLNASAKDAEFSPDAASLDRFQKSVLKDNPRAEFSDANPRRVRCSNCASWLEMRTLYDLVRWREHRKTAKCKKARQSGLQTRSLFTMGFRIISRSETQPIPSPAPLVTLPCPCLSAKAFPDVGRYILRTAVTGGGAPSRARIIDGLFPGQGLRWKDLSIKQKDYVLKREANLQKWHISHGLHIVSATNCMQNVAIRRAVPDERRMKFVPGIYRDKELGTLYLKHVGLRELVELDDGQSPWLKFALGCASGNYKSDVLTGMVQALVTKQDRMNLGKSMKNMKYSHEFSQFCDVLASTAPKAYETFCKQFGGPGLRTQRQRRSKMPRFEPDISEFNVANARNVLDEFEYEGPVALSWDDTSLQPSIEVHSSSKDECYILGGADGAILVKKGDDLDALFEKAKLNKADKLRIYMLSIPLPKVPPILIAAIARGSSETAPELAQMHLELLNLLHSHNIHPISMSSDGAEVERSVQRTIAETATTYDVYCVPNPNRGCNIELCIPLFYGKHPGVMVQDSKHGGKTARNQVQTGARAPELGFFLILFALISLILVHRRYFPTYPFLPWLHSTEVCEHAFGMLRTIKADFTFYDMLNLERKLRVLMRGAFGNLSAEEQAAQTAAGYQHTYFQTDDINLPVLMIFPTDAEIRQASLSAFDETSQLMKLLGIDATAMLKSYHPPEPTTVRLPRIPRPRAPNTIYDLMNLTEGALARCSFRDQELIESCEMAVAAQAVDESAKITALPDSNNVDVQAIRSDIATQLSQTSETVKQRLFAVSTLELVVNNALNFTVLVSQRREHQTKFAAKAVRQRGLGVSSVLVKQSKIASPMSDEPSLRDTLKQRLAQLLPKISVAGKTSGVNRHIRHAGSYGSTSKREENKATVIKVASANFVKLRADVFHRYRLIALRENMFCANVTEINPIKPSDFMIVLHPATRQVVLCEVATMYTRTSTHEWIPAAYSVGTPSYVYAWLYTSLAGNIFSSIACKKLSCPTILQIPRTHILYSLASFSGISQQDVTTVGGHPHKLVTLCADSLMVMQVLSEVTPAVNSAVNALVSAKCSGGAEPPATILPPLLTSTTLPSTEDDRSEPEDDGIDDFVVVDEEAEAAN
ncbi:unnamed protein product [Mycena citricolor]|uniref:Uncharacterized protein n=1 Tax=Mycena citricolor TaxID=2018698 RepID=A0AAD2HNY6_9AGAR|nr:unnamed protein product [Mycena citricolor]